MVLCVHWMSHAIFELTEPEPVKTGDNFCQINALVSTTASATDIGYNCVMCLFLYVKLKGSLKGI